MPFAGDLPDNYFAAYKAEMVRWKCKWQNVTSILIVASIPLVYQQAHWLCSVVYQLSSVCSPGHNKTCRKAECITEQTEDSW
jgi:hypothetical protein